MNSARDEQILALIDRLSNDIRLADKLSLAQTVQLLEMAKLELRTIVHSISDEELRLFTLAVEEDRRCPQPARRPSSPVTRRCAPSARRGAGGEISCKRARD
jgi:hypothetical protein